MLSQRRLLLNDNYGGGHENHEINLFKGHQSSDEEEIIVSSHRDEEVDDRVDDEARMDGASNKPQLSQRRVKQTSISAKQEQISETESLLDRANQKQKESMQDTYDKERLSREIKESSKYD